MPRARPAVVRGVPTLGRQRIQVREVAGSFGPALPLPCAVESPARLREACLHLRAAAVDPAGLLEETIGVGAEREGADRGER